MTAEASGGHVAVTQGYNAQTYSHRMSPSHSSSIKYAVCLTFAECVLEGVCVLGKGMLGAKSVWTPLKTLLSLLAVTVYQPDMKHPLQSALHE